MSGSGGRMAERQPNHTQPVLMQRFLADDFRNWRTLADRTRKGYVALNRVRTAARDRLVWKDGR